MSFAGSTRPSGRSSLIGRGIPGSRDTQAGSFTYPQAYNGSARPDVVRKRLHLSKIGNVRAVFHRPLPNDALLKTVTVIHEPCGEWYASLVFEPMVPLQDVVLPTATTIITTPVGIDLGLEALVTTSDGLEIPHPCFLRKAEKELKHLQKVFSRKKRGSKNQGKARHRLAVQHARVRRQRLDLDHKLSTDLVKEHDPIVFEDLHVKNMVRNHKLAKSIHDAGWGQLVKLTEYKAIDAGKRIVRVDPAYTTQECFYCGGTLNGKISLDIREFDCIGCGRHLYRDRNASMVVLKRGLEKVGQGMPEPATITPVETRPLLVQTTGLEQVKSRKQEAHRL